MPKADLLQGTLLALGPNHGWGIANRIRQMSGEGLTASQGSLCGHQERGKHPASHATSFPDTCCGSGWRIARLRDDDRARLACRADTGAI